MPADINPELDTESRASAGDNNLRPEESAEAIQALDSLAENITGVKPPATPAPAKPEATPAPEVKPEVKPEAAPEVKPEAAPAEIVPKAEAAPEVKPEVKPEATPEVDPLEAIELPPHTKPKTAESFGKLREAAKGLVAAATEKANAAQAEVAKLQQQIEELKKTTGQVPEAIQKELDDLRKGRAVQDIDNDPEFKKFDDQVKANEEVIYKRLRSAGYSEEHISKIKELGGPDNINWDPIFEKMPLPARRFIEATLVESERLRQQKDTALTKARANAEEYTRGRTDRETKQVTDVANGYVKNLAWAQKREIPTNATAEEKAAIEESNKAAEGVQSTLQKYLADRSPERFAELAVGTLIAHKLNADVAALRAAAKDHETNLKAVTTERDELRKKLEDIKKASAPRGRTDQVTAPKKPAPVTEVNGAENLDALAQEEISKASD